MIQIKILAGKDREKNLRFSKPRITCGRNSKCDIVLQDNFISSVHGEITQLGERATYRDLHSTNGSRIKRGKNVINLYTFISECEIHQGDEILLGDTVLYIMKVHSEINRLSDDLEKVLEETISKKTVIPLMTPPLDDAKEFASAKPERIFTLGLIGKSSIEDLLIFSVRGILEAFPKATHAIIGFFGGIFEGSQTSEIIFGMRREGDDNLTTSNIYFSHTFVQETVKQKSALLLPPPEYRKEEISSKSIMEIGIYSCLSVPLIHSAVPIGFIQVYNDFSSPYPLGKSDLELLVILSSILLLEYLNIQNREAFHRAELRTAISQVLTTLSHDSKNLVGGLERFIEIIDLLIQPSAVKKKGLSPEKVEFLSSYWGEMKEGIEFLGFLSRWMLSLAVGGTQREVKKKEIKIEDVVMKAWKMCKMCFNEREASRFQLATHFTVEKILADEMLLGSVLFNCFKNSCEAMTETGKEYEPVTVSVFPSSLFDIAAKAIAVLDRGPGIREDVLKRIFQGFYTTKGERGFGIGTTVILDFTVRQGGFFQIASRVGEGTLFLFYFPEKEGVRLVEESQEVYEIVDDFIGLKDKVLKKFK